MKFILTFIFFIIISSEAQGQSTDYNENDQLRIKLTDGTVIYAAFQDESDDMLNLTSELIGLISISKIHIKEVLLIRDSEGAADSTQSKWPIDYYNSTHYIASPSAYGLKKGQSYYQNIGVFWNSYTVGITDKFSISMGGEIISLFLQSIPVMYVSPKLSLPFKNNKGAFAVGTTIFTAPESNFKTFAFVSSSLTLGDRENNFTFGGGIGWNNEGGYKDEVVPFYFSGMKRVSRKISLMTENWLIVENDFQDLTSTIISAGIRIHFDKPGSALNVGIWRLLGEELGDVVAFPYLSAVIPIK